MGAKNGYELFKLEIVRLREEIVRTSGEFVDGNESSDDNKGELDIFKEN